MLRVYIAQQCFGLSDEGIEDAIYDSQSIRGFVGIDLTHISAPDATTLLKFRRLLEKHNLTRRIFDEINAHLKAWPDDARRNNRGRDPDRGPAFDQESGREARPGDTPVEER
jgi:hypothetical protein